MHHPLPFFRLRQRLPEEGFAIGLVAVGLLGAIFGFLRFNTRPATVFMGDAGSQLLGFSAITLSLSLTQGDTALSPSFRCCSWGCRCSIRSL